MATSPNTDNYQIAKGIVSFSTNDGSTWRDIGNVSSLVWTPAITKLDHFSSRAGVKSKDKSVVTETGATLKMTMDEITPQNFAMLALGVVDSSTTDGDVVKSLTETSIDGLIQCQGTNDVGAKVHFIGKVSFLPSGDFNMISEEWNVMEVTGEMLLHDDYGFGLFTYPSA